MAVYMPAGISTSGNRNSVWVDAIANPKSPTLAEVTSLVAAIDFSCFIANDWDGPSAEQAKDADERWCGKKVETMGDVAYTVADLPYVVDPQAKDAQGTNRLRVFLSPGKRGFLVMRRGKSMESPFAVGDRVDVYEVQLGVSISMATAANESMKNRQAIAVVGAVELDVPIAA